MGRARIPPPAIFLSIREISEGDIDRVAAAGALLPVLTPERRSALAGAMIEYHEDLTIWAASAKPGEVREKLADIEKMATDLLGALAKLSRGSVVSEAIAWGRLGNNPLGSTRLEGALASVAFLADAAGRAASGLAGKDGPAGKPYRSTLLRKLYVIFQEARGAGKFSKRGGKFTGKFVEMATAALEIVEGDQPTNSAVGHAIEDALSP